MSSFYLRAIFRGPDTPSLRARIRGLSNYMLKGYNLSRQTYTDLSRIISNIIVDKRDGADEETIRLILAHLQRVQFAHAARAEERGAERVEKIAQLLDGLELGAGCARVHDTSNTPNTRYLDFGCGDGSITQAIAGAIGAVPMGTDIVQTSPHVIMINPLLGRADNSIDLCTAFVSLHHVADVGAALHEIARILCNGGIFIIREHDYDGTSEMRAYLEFVHLFGALKCGEPFDVDDLPPIYRSAQQWTDLLACYGFVLLRCQRYSVHNPQGLYFAVYQLKK